MSDAASAHDQAEDYSKDENYAAAAACYDKAVELAAAAGTPSARYLANRAHNSIKLKRYADALADCDQALQLDPKNARALHRRAMALFYLDRFSEAQQAFSDAKAAGFEGDLSLWMRKCAAELEREANAPVAPIAAPVTSGAGAPIVHKIEALPPPPKKPAPVQPTPPAVPLTLAQKTRDQWFQDSQTVTVTLLAKNVKQEQVSIQLDAATATLTAKISFPSDSSEYTRTWKLNGGVQEAPAVALTPYKVEITLTKQSAHMWDGLERKTEQVPVAAMVAGPAAAEEVVPRENIIRNDINFAAYPTSAKTIKNWKEVEESAKKAEEEEKPEGEAALQKLFQSIYGGADEDTRRAMIKSFQTSGGTVLSTNWKEVKDKNYASELEAPKGQEIKSWNAKDRS